MKREKKVETKIETTIGEKMHSVREMLIKATLLILFGTIFSLVKPVYAEAATYYTRNLYDNDNIATYGDTEIIVDEPRTLSYIAVNYGNLTISGQSANLLTVSGTLWVGGGNITINNAGVTVNGEISSTNDIAISNATVTTNEHISSSGSITVSDSDVTVGDGNNGVRYIDADGDIQISNSRINISTDTSGESLRSWSGDIEIINNSRVNIDMNSVNGAAIDARVGGVLIDGSRLEVNATCDQGAQTTIVSCISCQDSLTVNNSDVDLGVLGSENNAPAILFNNASTTQCNIINSNVRINISGNNAATNGMVDLSIDSSNVTISSDDTHNALEANSLTVSGERSVISITSTSVGSAAALISDSCQLNDGLYIVTPAGGSIGRDPSDTYNTFLTNDGAVASHVVIRIPGAVLSQHGGEHAHTHNYEWQESRAATEDTDGEMIYVCTICGDVKYRETISAYNIFNLAVMEKIRKAGQGATVVVDTDKWISFHHMIIDTLAERPDVTLKINFLSEGHKGIPYTVTIPAHADYVSLVDKNGFTGFLFLGQKYGIALR